MRATSFLSLYVFTCRGQMLPRQVFIFYAYLYALIAWKHHEKAFVCSHFINNLSARFLPGIAGHCIG